MSSTAPFVSVITPFYNTEEYLAQCIESVLQQTYSNWEYILVNNCSTDRSAEIAEEYARLHPAKIRVEQNSTFLSQVANYNGALRLTSPKSKYCKVVQADDLLFPQCLELMVEVAERDASIGVVGSYALEGRDVCFGGLPFPSPVSTGRSICRLFFLENYYLFGSPTQLMLRSDLVLSRPEFYDEAHFPFEDAVVMFELLQNCKFGFAHQVLTFSRRDNATLMPALLALDSSAAFELLMLRQFGPSFLEPAEYGPQLKLKERMYAQILVDGMVQMRGAKFWKLHREMSKRMGYSLKSGRVWWPLFLSVCDVVFNPKRTLSRFIHGVRREG